MAAYRSSHQNDDNGCKIAVKFPRTGFPERTEPGMLRHSENCETFMYSSQRFSLNEPTVIQEIIDGEAIIADLSQGFYYSLDSTGSQVWNALVSGSTIDSIVDACTANFTGDREEIASGIYRLLDRLQEEQLIVPRVGEGSNGNTDLTEVFAASGEAFTAPVLSKYTDMEQLLLLDPIHDVDETGWPNEPGTEAQD